MDVDEGSIRRLQRTAYGAGATDAERARAASELAELGTSIDGPGAGSGEADTADAAADPAPARPVPNGPLRGAALRWTFAAGGVGLLVGAALGWGVGQWMSVDSALPSTARPSESADLGEPLEGSDLIRLFDRLPPVAESVKVASVDEVIDPASVRLLATRVDGPAAYLARTVDGEDVCLVLVLPAAPSRSECTVDGRLPAEGLRILYGAEGYGLSAAELDPSGTVSLGLVTF